MNKIVRVLNELKLNKRPQKGTSVEILENMNKMNLIFNSNVSEDYALELWLSMSLKSDADVVAFASQFGNAGNFNLATFFEQFALIREFNDSTDIKSIEIKTDYYEVITNIIQSNHEQGEPTL